MIIFSSPTVRPVSSFYPDEETVLIRIADHEGSCCATTIASRTTESRAPDVATTRSEHRRWCRG